MTDPPQNESSAAFEDPFSGIPLTSEQERDAREHVQALVDAHGLVWTESDDHWLSADGDLTTREIAAPRLTDDVAYLVTLHEIGHHALGAGTYNEHGEVVFEQEVAAWAWALEHSRLALSENGVVAIHAAMASHAQDAGRFPTGEERRELGARIDEARRASEGVDDG